MFDNRRSAHLKFKFLFPLVILLVNVASMFSQSAGKPFALPTRYNEHRFFVQPTTVNGARLDFFTDTGGGTFVFSDVAEELKLSSFKIQEDGQEYNATKLPNFKVEVTIPSPLGSNEQLVLSPRNKNDWLYCCGSGVLGQAWFAGRTWTFDYPNRLLLLRSDGDLPKHKAKEKLILNFKTDSAGNRLSNFPRIQVLINDETLDLLFDTGASTKLSENALSYLKDNRPDIRATSFITANIFDKWRKKHPEWHVIENAEAGTGQAMIKVPQVTIAGYKLGPVWFTRRPNQNFHEFMSQYMGKRVEGALGGNVLHRFRITVDYPKAVAVFKRNKATK